MKYRVWLMRLPVCWHKDCTDAFPPISASPLKMDNQEEEVQEEDFNYYEKTWEEEIEKVRNLGDKAVLIGQQEEEFIIRSYNPSQEQVQRMKFP